MQKQKKFAKQTPRALTAAIRDGLLSRVFQPLPDGHTPEPTPSGSEAESESDSSVL
jgi:hypothetical protein